MNLFHPNTDRFADYIEKGKFVMLWRITVFFLIIFSVLAVGTLSYDPIAAFLYGGVLMVAVFGLVYLNYTTNLKRICYVYSISGMLILAISYNISTGLLHIPDYFWSFSVVVFAFTTLGSRMGWFIIGCFGIIVLVHYCFFIDGLMLSFHTNSMNEIVGLSAETLIALAVTGYFISQHLIFMGYTEGQMSLANAELELQNQIIQRKSDENAVLVKEIHHRVKNNLQIIISLLRMHRDEVRSMEARKDFDEAINRILSMALLHQQMYREKELSRFSLKDYIESLSRDIIASYKQENQEINCTISIADFHMKLETVVPLGLMVNELISNSLKHAFSDKKKGEIVIRVEERESGFFMHYADSGLWVDDEPLVNGFGLDLVHMLTEQLNGEMIRSGSTFELTAVNL